MPLLSGTERLNLPRFFRKKRFFDVYSLRFNDISQHLALWYRQYVLLRAKGEPEVGLTLVLYDTEQPDKTRICHQARSLQEARIEDDIFYFSVAGGEFYQKGCHGEIEDGGEGEAVRWQFEWVPSTKPFRHYPFRFFYKSLWPLAKIVTPNPDISISGQLQWGDQSWRFKDVQGCQTHIWGEQSGEQWTWGQVSLFEGDEKVIFEGVSGQVRFHGRLLPMITMLRIVLNGQEYRLNRPWQWRHNISFSHADRWHFEATHSGTRFIGDVFVDPKTLTGVTYIDPDGSPRYVYRTESASLRLQQFRRDKQEWILERTFQSQPAMAYEFAQRDPVPDIPLVA